MIDMKRTKVDKQYSYGECVTDSFLRHRLNWVNGKQYIHPYISKHNSWLHGLHLDFLMPSRHLAFEIDGAQHRECVNWNGKLNRIQQKMNLFNQLSRDLLKDKYCEQHGVKLVRINTDYVKKSTIRKHVKDTLNDVLINHVSRLTSIITPMFSSDRHVKSNIQSYSKSYSMALHLVKLESDELNLLLNIAFVMNDERLDIKEFTPYDLARVCRLHTYNHYTLMFKYLKHLSDFITDKYGHRLFRAFIGAHEIVKIYCNSQFSFSLSSCYSRSQLITFDTFSKSRYSKLFYDLLIRGFLVDGSVVSVSKIKSLLLVPKSYSNTVLYRRAFYPIHRDLNSIHKHVYLSKITRGRGGRIIDYCVCC